MPEELINHQLWWHGPPLLLKYTWRAPDIELQSEEAKKEERKVVLTHVALSQDLL
ncbi:unnamed protein product, partial [Allacma fusca]